VTKSGDRHEVVISATAVEHDDHEYLLTNVRDIEARVERERELDRVRDLVEFVLEETDAVIWERDPETGAITTYPGPCSVLDGPIETASDFRDRIHPDDISRVERAVQAAAEYGESRRVEFRTAPGVSAERVETRIRPVTDEDGSVELLTGLARDITEARRRERERERRNERLETVASIISHDLRNPLNVCTGHLEMAREECDSEHLNRVATSLDRSVDIVEDMLTLVDQGQSTESVSLLSLEALVGECERTVETPDANIRIESDCTFEADADRVRHILENLFRNAVEHGGPGITVRVGRLDDGFYVADDGPGISPEERDQVFEAGYTTSPDGTGFGLPIVEQIADSHGWDVAVTESRDGGARFEIRGVHPR
jgi:signal transduction histidine kinase